MKIYYGMEPNLSQKDRKMFYRGKYECKTLLKTGKGQPVVISQSKDTDFPSWKVEYGLSCVVFNTYDEALAFCKGRFYSLDGKAV